jgi:MFS family permease
MALAQIAQALATLFLFQLMIDNAGFKGTLAFGAVSWVLLYGVYVVGKPKWLVIAIQPFHGMAYVFFVIVGQVFTNSVAPEAIRSSMQALIFAATTGVGLFLGTQFAGIVMDTNSEEGRFVWPRVWAVPAIFTLAGVLTLLSLFHDPPPATDTASPPPAITEAE